MDTAQITTILTVIAILPLIALSLLFLLLSLAGRVLTDDDHRSPMGNALGHVSGAAGVLMLSVAGILVVRLSVGLDEPLKPDWLNVTLRTTLAASGLWCLIAGGVAAPKLIARFRKRPVDSYEINQAAIFGLLGQALPTIVSDHKGIVQHTTAEFDKLVGALPGELIGKSLNVIMPERYIAGHDHGMRRYVETREAHIIGKVVNIDMLRRDGKEIPVYLGLYTTDVDGNPWFVALILPNSEKEKLPPAHPDYFEGINLRQDVRESDQNIHEVYQDERAANLDRRGLGQDKRQVTADERQVTADERQVTADERQVTADERQCTADERDTAADERDVTADQRDIDQDAREVKVDVKELKRQIGKEKT